MDGTNGSGKIRQILQRGNAKFVMPPNEWPARCTTSENLADRKTSQPSSLSYTIERNMYFNYIRSSLS